MNHDDLPDDPPTESPTGRDVRQARALIAFLRASYTGASINGESVDEMADATERIVNAHLAGIMYRPSRVGGLVFLFVVGFISAMLGIFVFTWIKEIS